MLTLCLLVLPPCRDDMFARLLTRGSTGPLSACDSKCVTNKNLATQGYLGGTVEFGTR